MQSIILRSPFRLRLQNQKDTLRLITEAKKQCHGTSLIVPWHCFIFHKHILSYRDLPLSLPYAK